MRKAALATAALGLMVLGLAPADAARKRVAVPNKFDGNWSIAIVTLDGPCDRASRYGVQIYNGQAIYPGGDVQVSGSVAPSGAVSGVISRDGTAARVSGRLSPGGSGGGSWSTDGSSPISCSGRWTASRRG